MQPHCMLRLGGLRFCGVAAWVVGSSVCRLASATQAESAASKAQRESPRASADAGAPSSKRVLLGVRLGYGLPFGDATELFALQDLFSNLVPITLEAGYAAFPQLSFRGYFEYAVASAGEQSERLCAALDCRADNLRFGLLVQLRFRSGASIEPWAGVGTGYEIATVRGSNEFAVALRGAEFASLHAGTDFDIGRSVALGPFASFSTGRYSIQLIDAGTPTTMTASGTLLHHWLVIGVRSTVSL